MKNKQLKMCVSATDSYKNHKFSNLEPQLQKDV